MAFCSCSRSDVVPRCNIISNGQHWKLRLVRWNSFNSSEDATVGDQSSTHSLKNERAELKQSTTIGRGLFVPFRVEIVAVGFNVSVCGETVFNDS